MRPVIIASLASVVVLAHSVPAVSGAAPVYCSTWQQIATCQSPSGYTSTESRWQGMTFGQDSDGDRWTTTRWRDTTVTTVTPPPER